mmetsp:Transcript_2206/g.6109  ORF Transcript_2206/g.6109 Transcript_2206/m.6109 type:complete len:341 (+) Transcript_2206:1021-2043(+)
MQGHRMIHFDFYSLINRVLGVNSPNLGGVVVQVVKQRGVMLRGGIQAETATSNVMHLVGATADSVQGGVAVEEVATVLGRVSINEYRDERLAVVNPIVRNGDTREVKDGIEKIHVGRHTLVNASGLDIRPPDEAGDAVAALEGGSLLAPEGAVETSLCAESRPGTVVRGEDDVGIVKEALGLQVRHHATNAGVHLTGRVSVETPTRRTLEFGGSEQRNVDFVVGEVEEERLAVVHCRVDKGSGAVRHARHQRLQVDGLLDDRLVCIQRGRCEDSSMRVTRHPVPRRAALVLTVRQPEPVVKAKVQGERVVVVPQVPLAHQTVGIVRLVEQLRHRVLRVHQ